MTEEYKQGILDYITGNLEIENQKPNSFRESNTFTNGLSTIISEMGIVADSYITLTSETTSNYLIYGNYEEGGSNYGYIIILNADSQVQGVLLSYESGTLLEPFEILAYDEDGNIYGLDKPRGSSNYRVILLNNIAISVNNKYSCKLRASYYVNDSGFMVKTSHLDGTSVIKKIPGEATYYIFGQKSSHTRLITFTINVGSANEWHYYSGSSTPSYNVMQASDFILNQDTKDSLYIYYKTGDEATTLKCEYFNGTTLTRHGTYNLQTNISDIRVLNDTTVYISSRLHNEDESEGRSYTLFLYEWNNGILTTLATYSIYGLIVGHYLSLVNGILFSKASTYTDDRRFLTYCGAYYGGQFIKSDLIEMQIGEYLYTNCVVQKTYSLYEVFVQGKTTINKPRIVIYDSQYSGATYKDYNYLVPLHSELYSNGYVCFARTLYNKQLYQNKSTSIVNIPNNYLNNININQSNLLSATMLNLVSNGNNIVKNMYENLFINFINTINVMDEDTNTMYSDTANYINVNINTGTDIVYNNTSVSKVRINYTTPRVFNINWVWNTDHYETAFTIYTSEIPTSIEFISEDEQTTYITKYFDFALNKYYTISQKLRIE